ncbi:hypothetical protein AB0P36_16465 [Streptomyces flavidovirens]|uniref:hypothetical protein n=1 Tax=Streptomyces flavidovirens TaxID=67298 RepID=UPI00342AC344
MMNQPVIPDVEQVLRHNYNLLAKQVAMRITIIAVLVAGSYGLHSLGVVDFVLIPPFVTAAFVLLFSAIRLANGLRLGPCKRVLNTYPLEYRTRVERKGSQWLLLGDVYTIKISTRGQHGAPHMRAINASAIRRWPKGAEDGGAWVAGDLAFGGVVILPGTNDMLFMQPSNWEKFSQEREQADPARFARAEQAGITKRLEREPRVMHGA